jgi:hypothetical protein
MEKWGKKGETVPAPHAADGSKYLKGRFLIIVFILPDLGNTLGLIKQPLILRQWIWVLKMGAVYYFKT